MRKRVLPLLVVPILILAFVAMALTPLSASAATMASTKPLTASQRVHFLLKKNLQSSQVRPFTGGNLVYHGGPVMGGTTNVFAIFWDPVGNVSANYDSLIQSYFNDIGGTGLYNNNSQYTDSNGNIPFNSVLAGVFFDTTPYPESPLLDSDIQNEVVNAQNANGWSSSLDNIFFVFLDKGQNLCFNSSLSQCASNSFCAYHSSFGSDTIYAAMPYAASFNCRVSGQTEPNGDDADLTINVTSHEQMEAATDPLGNAWFDTQNPAQEIGDKCNFTFGSLDANNGDLNVGGDEYMVQREWDNNIGNCVMTGP